MDSTIDRLARARASDLAAVRSMVGAADDARAGEALGALGALVCDIGARPAGAPHFLHVRDALLAVRRDSGALVVDYDPAAAPVLERVVDAERTCCAGLDWQLERVVPDERPGTSGTSGGALLRLRVAGTPEQLDVMQLLFDGAGEQTGTVGGHHGR